MNMKVSFKTGAMKIEGVPQLIKTLKEISKTMEGNPEKDQFRQMVTNAFMKPALMIRDEARDMAPVVTGKLKAGIFAAAMKKRPGAVAGVHGVHYAKWVEYGTEKTTPNPYFRPAILATRPLAANMLAPDLKKVIEAVAADYAEHPK